MNPGTIQKDSKKEHYTKRIKREKQVVKHYTPQQAADLPYKCKFCPIRFKICSALGGHISKAHPGQSKAYNHKKTVRENRELERSLHKQARDQYILSEKSQVIQDQIKNDDMCNVNRGIIKKIKKDLVLKDAKFSTLRKKYTRSGPSSPDVPPGEGTHELFQTRKINFDENIPLVDNEPFDIMKEISQEIKNDPI